jgi:hypothetical protein
VQFALVAVENQAKAPGQAKAKTMAADPRVPTSRKALLESGYREGSAGKCRACDARMEWWQTPAGANMPMHVVQVEGCEMLICHFVDCEARQQFRKANRIGKPKKPTTGSLFE